MSSSSRKLRHEAQQESAHERQVTSSQRHAAREFGSAEELLRCDAENVVVPPHIAARLQESLAHEGPRPKAWWQRWFRRE